MQVSRPRLFVAAKRIVSYSVYCAARKAALNSKLRNKTTIAQNAEAKATAEAKAANEAPQAEATARLEEAATREKATQWAETLNDEGRLVRGVILPRELHLAAAIDKRRQAARSKRAGDHCRSRRTDRVAVRGVAAEVA